MRLAVCPVRRKGALLSCDACCDLASCHGCCVLCLGVCAAAVGRGPCMAAFEAEEHPSRGTLATLVGRCACCLSPEL